MGLAPKAASSQEYKTYRNRLDSRGFRTLGGRYGLRFLRGKADVSSCGFITVLVAGDGGVDGAGPGVDAAGEGLGVVEALVAEPHGDGERTLSVMAEDDDGGVGVELLMGAGGYFAHGHEERVGQVSRLELPGFADVEQERGGDLLALLGECLDSDFGF
jgi:hypothetical protein